MAVLGVGIAAGLGAFGAAGTTAAVAATFAFSAIATAIDSFLLFPALFPPEDVKGDRLSDLPVSTASEGTSRNTVFGELNRIPGQVTWLGATVEYEESTGGKGGGGPDVSSYTYKANIAVEVTDGSIASIDKILTDSFVIYVNPLKPSLVNKTITPDDIEFDDLGGFTSSSWQAASTCRLKATSTNFELFKDEGEITIAGFTGTGVKNNTGYVFDTSDTTVNSVHYGSTLVWRIAFVSNIYRMNLAPYAKDGSGVETLLATNNTGATPPIINYFRGVSTPAGDDVSLTATSATYRPDLIDGIEIYDGTQSSSTIDPFIDAEEDIVPSFKDRTYFTLEQLNLTHFGNRLPNFSIQVSEQVAKPLSTTFSDILTLAGFESSQYDVTALAATTMSGYNVVGSQSPRSSLQPLMMTYNVAVQEDNEKLVFFFRDNAASFALDTDRMGTEDTGSPGSFSDADPRNRPSRLNVKYIDPDLDFQTGDQVYRKVDSPDQGSQTTDLHTTMTADEAQCRARRILWSSWANSRAFETTIAPRYYDVLPGDIATFTHNLNDGSGESAPASVRVFVLSTTRGENGEIELAGLVEDPAPYFLQLCETDSNLGYSAPSAPSNPSDGRLTIIDLCSFRNEDVNTPGAYFASCLMNPSAPWQGASIYESDTTGIGASGTFNSLLKNVSYEAPIGMAVSALADGVAGVMDRINTVDITFMHGSVSSVTLDELNAGSNLAVLGDEVIAFKTAELLSGGDYRLSNILRGLRGTLGTDHGVGDRFVMVNSLGFEFFEVPYSSGQSGYYTNYKIVTAGQTAANVLPISSGFVGPMNFRIDANNKKPAPICRIRGRRDGLGNIIVSFQRTTRSIVRGIAATRPLNEFQPQFVFYLRQTSVHSTPPGGLFAQIVISPNATVDAGLGGSSGYSFTLTSSFLTGLAWTWATGDPIYLEGFQVSPAGGFVGRSLGEVEI